MHRAVYTHINKTVNTLNNNTEYIICKFPFIIIHDAVNGRHEECGTYYKIIFIFIKFVQDLTYYMLRVIILG